MSTLTIKGKIKPLEKEKCPPKQVKVQNLIFLILLIAFGVFFAEVVYKNAKKRLGARQIPPLSTQAETQINQLKEGAESAVGKTAQDTEEAVGNVLGEANKQVEKTTKKTQESVSDFLFDKTIGSMLEQLKKLPPDTQRKVKEYINKILP